MRHKLSQRPILCGFLLALTLFAQRAEIWSLVDVGLPAGIDFHHHAGSADKDYLLEMVGSGVALFDYDNDGLVDIYFVTGLPSPPGSSGKPECGRLYRNIGKMRFQDVTDSAGVGNGGWGIGAAAADFDNDGWTDLYVTNYGQNVLFRNNGDGTFSDVTQEAGVGGGNWSTGAAWGDYDSDGFLDLYVARYVDFDPDRTPRKGSDSTCRYRGIPVACGPRGLPGLADILYHNNGDTTFSDVTVEAGIHDPGYYGFTVLWLDYDEDGRQDIFVANDGTPNFLWRNEGRGRFTNVGAESGVAYNENGLEQACMGASAGDFDNDGDIDLFVTNFAEDDNTIYSNDGDGFFSDVTVGVGLAGRSWLELGWGAGLVDFDNDGWKDIFVANGHIYPEVKRLLMDSGYLQKLQMFRNLHGETFIEISSNLGPDFRKRRSARGASFGDLDNDGCVDVVINNLDSSPSVILNHCDASRTWATLQLQGVRSNRDAIGALVKVYSETGIQTSQLIPNHGYVGTSDKRLSFGLGGAGHIDKVEIIWPSGVRQVVHSPPTNQILTIKESAL